MQLQKVYRNLIGMLRNSGVLCSTLEPCKCNSFCPIFFLYFYSMTLFVVCLVFFPSLLHPLMSETLPAWQVLANLEFGCPISYPLLSFSQYIFFPHQDPVFLFKAPDLLHLPFISPFLPLQDLMLVWSVLFLHLPLSQWY